MEFETNYTDLIKYINSHSLDLSHLERGIDGFGDECRYFEENGSAINGLTSEYIDKHLVTKTILPKTELFPSLLFGLIAAGNVDFVRISLKNRLISEDEVTPFTKTAEELKLSIRTNFNVDRLNRSISNTFPISTMAMRGNEGLSTWRVFINGKKIPDEMVYVYGFAGGTELYIPKEYFKYYTKPEEYNIANDYYAFKNELCVIKNRWAETAYPRHLCVGNVFSSASISFSGKHNFNSSKFLIYDGVGKLLNKNEYNVICAHNTNNNTTEVTINFNQKQSSFVEVYMDVIETYRDASIHKIKNKDINSNAALAIVYPLQGEDVLKEAPIFIPNIDVYVNGIRISRKRLKQLTYRHILVDYTYYNITPSDNTVVELIFTDKEISNTPFNDYFDEWMRYEKWLTEKNELYAIDDNSEKPAPDDKTGLLLDFSNMDRTFRFDKTHIENDEHGNPKDVYDLDFFELNKYKIALNCVRTDKEKISAYILDNPANFIIFLRYFSVKIRDYTIHNRTGLLQKYTLDNNDKDNIFVKSGNKILRSERTPRCPDIFINDKYLSKYYTSLGIDKCADVINVDNAVLEKYKDKKCTVKISDHPAVRRTEGVLRFNPNVLASTENGLYVNAGIILADKIPNAEIKLDFGDYDIDDILVYQAVQDTKMKDYVTAEIPCNRQFRIIPKSAYEITKVQQDEHSQLDIKIRFKRVEDGVDYNNIIYIVNPRKANTLTINLNNISDPNKTDRLYLNSINELGDLVPFAFGKFNYKLFVNGTFFVRDADYIIQSPENDDKITFSSIVFAREIPKDAIIEFTCNGIQNPQLVGKRILGEYISSKYNKYGFIFFDNLPIPFDCAYMDLFLNDKKVDDKDIIVYSDRLIRVLNHDVPFTSIAVVTRFNRDFDWFLDNGYINKYLEAKKRIVDIDALFKKYVDRQSIGDSGGAPQIVDINDIYEDAPDDIDDSQKVKNKQKIIKNEDGTINGDPPTVWFDPLINRLAKDFNRFINKIPRVLDGNNLLTPEQLADPIFKQSSYGVLFKFNEYIALMTDLQKKSKEIILDSNPDSNIILSETWVLDPNELYKSRAQTAILFMRLLDNYDKSVTIDMNDSDATHTHSSAFEYYLYPNETPVIDLNETYSDDIEEDLIIDLNKLKQ